MFPKQLTNLIDCRNSRILCCVLLGAGFLAFFVSLDRYPQIYPDDSFYNYPAISYLEGKGFKYRVAGAPHGDTVFAYHGPIFPHLQIAVFRAFGANQLTFRATQYVSAYLAVAALCGFLISRKLPLAAVILAVAWLGDRSSQEVMLGRMEGLALLFLAGSFMSLVKSLEAPSLKWASFCGACTLGAAAVHPVALVFTPLALGCLLLLLRGGDRIRASAGFGLGMLAAVALVIWLWWPYIAESAEQLAYSIFQGTVGRYGSTLSERLAHLWRVLGWARYWSLALAIVSLAVLTPIAVARWLKTRGTVLAQSENTIFFAAVCFSIAGLACAIRGGVGNSYYLIYFTVWPVMALAASLERAASQKERRVWITLAAALVMAAWLPSFAWNCLRFRESVLFRDEIAHERFTSQLVAIIPQGARVVSIPELLIVGQEAGLDVSPTPWHEERVTVGDDAWLLVKEAELTHPRWFAAECLSSRKVVFKGEAFSGAPLLGYRFAVLGPAEGSPALASIQERN